LISIYSHTTSLIFIVPKFLLRRGKQPKYIQLSCQKKLFLLYPLCSTNLNLFFHTLVKTSMLRFKHQNFTNEKVPLQCNCINCNSTNLHTV
jgi:hypothetical protein